MAISKVIYGGNTLIDLTGDTLTKDKALKGYTFHGADGEVQTGTCEYDVDSSEVTAKVAEVLAGKTFAAGGTIKTGTMPNKGKQLGLILEVNGVYPIPQGYHDGSGTVQITPPEKAKIIPENIRQGVEILGVTGTMSALEGVKAQALTVTPSTAQQVVLPESGYNYISQVTVAAIPYVEIDNAAGGTTVTIG